jgi:hypothetical protein
MSRKPREASREAVPPEHTRAREPEPYRDGKSGVFLALAEVSRLGTVDERRAALMERLEHVWRLALERTYTNKHGDETPNPDTATALRCVEVADALMNEADEKQKKRGQLVDMTIFGPQRKAAAG